MNRPPLSIDLALSIQREQLNNWRAVLTSQAYAVVEQQLARDTQAALATAIHGWEIPRGTDIDMIVRRVAANIQKNSKHPL